MPTRARVTLHGASGLGICSRSLLPVLVAATLTSACDIALSGSREEATDTWTRTYQLAPQGAVEISNTNGFISVKAGTDSNVEVRAVRIARAATPEAAKDLLGRITMREEVAPDRIRLEAQRSGASSFGRGGFEVRYTVTVPATARLDLETTNGDVRVFDAAGGVTAQTTNGAIEGRNLAGAVTATTTNGGVDIELKAFTAEVELETTNGGVRVRLPADAKANISARTNNGGIDVTGLSIEQSERSRRRLEGRLNGGGPALEVETTNGGITITG